MTNKYIWVIFGVILISRTVGAGFDVDENSSFVGKNYFSGEFISGRINMSFSGHGNREFTNNLGGGGIKIFDLLNVMNLTAGRDFICSPSNCKQGYNTEGIGWPSYEFDLGREEKLYGFKIGKGAVENILEFRFDLSSNASATCSPKGQIEINLFKDESVDFYNSYTTNNSCGERNFGCFSASESSQNAIIGEDYYCEKVSNISSAPAYEVGAVLQEEQQNGEIEFYLFKADGERIGSVGVRNAEPPIAKAVINKPVRENFDGYVCVRKGATGIYKIRVESSSACGWKSSSAPTGIPSQFGLDYEIYVTPLQYAPLSGTRFNDAVYEKLTGKNLKDDIKRFLDGAHSNGCDEEGCVIPLGFRGIENTQHLMIDNILVRYENENGIFETRKVYPLTGKDFTISANYTSLDIEKMNFAIPPEDGNKTFKLFFDENEILSELISIKTGFNFTIGPRFASPGIGMVFTAFSSENITSSNWDFGDGSLIVTSRNNRAMHSYENEGEYIVEVTLTNRYGSISKKKFVVVVGDARMSANILLNDYKARIRNIESKLNGHLPWVRDKIKEALEFEAKKSSIRNIEDDYNLLGNSSADIEFIHIIDDILGVEIPSSIEKRISGVLPLDVGFDSINVAYIEEISGESAPNKEELKKSIIEWMNRNYDADIEFFVISGLDGGEWNDILTTYKINLIKKSASQIDSVYLVIDYNKNAMIFKTNYGAEEIGSSATYILADSSLDAVEFLILNGNAPKVERLGIYLSPDVRELDVKKPFGGLFREGYEFRWGRFLLGMTGLIILVLVVYLILQIWYKKYYEKHLFPNSDDLYNLINFIYNSRKAGLRDSRIRDKLNGKGWSGEKITYSFKKIDGKKTGLWEIPLLKFLENKKVRSEIRKRQGGAPIDTRFIKRPYHY